MAVIKAILEGQRDAGELLALCHKSIREHKSEEELKSLNGYYSPLGLFALRQGYQGYLFYQGQIKACDQAIEQEMERLHDFHQNEDKKAAITSVKGRKPIRDNKPQVAYLGGHLLSLFSDKDATQLPGITDYSWLQLYSEIGNDLTYWLSEKHFTSWLGLSPGQHQSGKKNKSRRRKSSAKAGQVFRRIAQSLIESKKIAPGAFGRRLKAKRGSGIAVKATARKLAVLYRRIMVKGCEYVEKGIKAYEEQLQLQKEKWLQKTAHVGYKLTLAGTS